MLSPWIYIVDVTQIGKIVFRKISNFFNADLTEKLEKRIDETRGSLQTETSVEIHFFNKFTYSDRWSL